MDWDKIDQALQIAVQEERTVLTEIESKQIIEALGIAVPAYKLAETADQAVRFANEIGFPVALKIVSPEIVHKSDASGVFLNVSSDEEVRRAFGEIIQNARNYNPAARIQGVSVQKMIRSGIEVIVGMKRDEVFGPIILFGLGGIFVELLKDVSLRTLPLAEQDIDSMFTELKGSQILNGFRGSKPVDFQSLRVIIMKISQLSARNPQITEMELNPVFVQEDDSGAWAVDARILIEKRQSGVAA